MSDYLNIVFEYLKKRTTESLLGLLALATLSPLILAKEHLLELVKNTDPSILVLIIILGFATIVILASCLVFYFPRFKHIPSLGVHENIKTGAYFCSYCLLTKKLQSPLNKTNDGLSCPACSKSIYNQEYLDKISNVKTKYHWGNNP